LDTAAASCGVEGPPAMGAPTMGMLKSFRENRATTTYLQCVTPLWETGE